MKREERTRDKEGRYCKENYSKYIGKKYGRLTILEIYSLENRIECKCRCECGTIKKYLLNSLLKGGTKSCGCIVKNIEYENLVGRRFGRLVVVEELEKSELSQARYKCKCDCGNEIEVYGANLLYNQTNSCGCIHKICSYNDTIPKSNKSGVKGVYYSKRDNQWVAKLIYKGKPYRKSFPRSQFEEAVAYRKFLENKYHKPMKDEYKKFKSSKGAGNGTINRT